MAYGGQMPQLQAQSHDLFAANDMFHDFDDESAENTLRAYGATAGSTPIQRPKLGLSSGDTDEIPMYDFQLEAHKDPLILSPRSSPYVSTVKPSLSMQSFHSVASDMTNLSVLSYNQYDSWVHHPKVRENWRLVLGSGILMVLGIVLIIVGIGIALSPVSGYHCIVIIVIGTLCLIPGGYHFIYIYCAAIGRPGFHFSNLPALR
ncbi:transmembrane protein 134-like [Littorina saxatilis]|uniref:Transmembrane protein 134 n=1 Tax=Littorina saxatilis TaxID=31220 RepID=A0AAN9BKV2_9CAEN